MPEKAKGFKLSAFKVDSGKMSKGAWVDWIPFVGVKARLLVASINSPALKQAERNLVRENAAALREDQSFENMVRVLTPAIAEHLLLGWEGLLDDKTGEPIPHSKKAALDMLNSPELYFMAQDVYVAAGNRNTFRKEVFEDSEKNSQTA